MKEALVSSIRVWEGPHQVLMVLNIDFFEAAFQRARISNPRPTCKQVFPGKPDADHHILNHGIRAPVGSERMTLFTAQAPHYPRKNVM